ncbi:hypothetical protein A4H96_02490 [Acidithiobacillus ferrooxidans]|uniref:Uncharacterized protein n=1 Tax=Acidithiobacillus ferrooxidans TaxID=920 RepID=A0A179BMK2_ACIFR|nr:hypothetical protein A4H96_02490 [Acidithiobacillus ferrooxidans]
MNKTTQRRPCPQGWPHGRGISGRMPVERVAGCSWIRWPDHRGISGRMPPEYAPKNGFQKTVVENRNSRALIPT